MSDRGSNNGWKIGLGLIAGAALGYWLNTEQGKKVRRETSDQINTYGNKASTFTKEKYSQAQEGMNHAVNQAQSGLNSAIERGQELLNELSTYAKNTISRTADKAEASVETASNSLEKGIKKAKSKVNKKANNLEASAN